MMNEQERIDELKHFGVKGMRWGRRKEAVANGINKFKEAGKAHDAKTAERDAKRKEAVANGINKFKEAGKAHDAKTAERDAKRKEAVKQKIEARRELKVAKRTQKADKVWERNIVANAMKKFNSDTALKEEVIMTTRRALAKKGYTSREDMTREYTKAYVNAMNKKLDKDPTARNISDTKRLRMEVYGDGGYIRPVIQDKVSYPKKRG